MPFTSASCASAAESVAATGSVLVVEDPLVSKLVQAVLKKHGYEVKLKTEAEALAWLRAGASEIGVLLTNSPGPFLEFSDRVPLLYLTSAPNLLLQTAFRSCRVVVKPFAPEDLARAVGALTAPL